MLTTIAGSIVNLVLDPILIFGLDMSVAGAAVASVFARIAVLVIGVRYVIKRQYMPNGLGISEFREDLGAILKIAVPAMLTNVATPIGNAYVIASMSTFGDGSVAGFSIVGRLMPVAFGVIFALSGAVGPIVGQNFGAGRMDRVHHTLVSSLIFSTAVVVAVSLLLLLTQSYIVDAFRAQPAAAALINFFVRLLLSALYLVARNLYLMQRSIIWGVLYGRRGLTGVRQPLEQFHLFGLVRSCTAPKAFWLDRPWVDYCLAY